MTDRLLESAFHYEDFVAAQLNTQQDQNALRYVFAPFDRMLIMSPTGIPPLEPGRIHLIPHLAQPVGMPYLQLYFKDRPFDAKEVNFKPETQSGEIRISPAPTVDALISRYGEQGAIQVTSLYNLPAKVWQSLALNDLIFGKESPTTPQAYLAKFDAVRERVQEFKEEGTRAEIIAQVKVLVPRILAELEAAVNRAAGWSKVKAEEANAARANGELKKFSRFEHKVFGFSGVTPHDQALNQMAETQNAAIAVLPQLVEKLVSGNIAPQAPVIDWAEFGRGLAAGLKEAGVVSTAPSATEAKPGKK
jgi:hypothetical protein